MGCKTAEVLKKNGYTNGGCAWESICDFKTCVRTPMMADLSSAHTRSVDTPEDVYQNKVLEQLEAAEALMKPRRK